MGAARPDTGVDQAMTCEIHDRCVPLADVLGGLPVSANRYQRAVAQ